MIALSVLSRCSFLDRVRTAAVRPSLLTQILSAVLFVRQKDLVSTLSADHIGHIYELQL